MEKRLFMTRNQTSGQGKPIALPLSLPAPNGPIAPKTAASTAIPTSLSTGQSKVRLPSADGKSTDNILRNDIVDVETHQESATAQVRTNSEAVTGAATKLDYWIDQCVNANEGGSAFVNWDQCVLNAVLPAYAVFLSIVCDPEAMKRVCDHDVLKHRHRTPKKNGEDPARVSIYLALRPKTAAEKKKCWGYAKLLEAAKEEGVDEHGFMEWIKNTTLKEVLAKRSLRDMAEPDAAAARRKQKRPRLQIPEPSPNFASVTAVLAAGDDDPRHAFVIDEFERFYEQLDTALQKEAGEA